MSRDELLKEREQLKRALRAACSSHIPCIRDGREHILDLLATNADALNAIEPTNCQLESMLSKQEEN